MINWNATQRTECPMTMHLNSQDFINPIKSIPCHPQAVERCIKDVTEVSQNVCGEDNRNSMVMAKRVSRSKMLSYNKKAEYNLFDQYR